MNRIRSAFNSVMKTERYSRFTLQPDGERHVEVKLSDDADTEGEAGGSPSFRPVPPHRSRSRRCLLVVGGVLVLLFGYMIGYVSHRQPRPGPGNCSTTSTNVNLPMSNPTFPTDNPVKRPTVPVPAAPQPEPELTWNDITKLLKQKLTKEALGKTLRYFDRPTRSAGSQEDVSLANHLFGEFQKLEMDPWSDIHYVQLQTPDSERPNRVLFDSKVFQPVGYLAYSAAKTVQGKLVYGNYGRQEDLDVLQKKNVELRGSVLLLRAGKINFAEQVDNAATKGASAVLIYPDVKDYSYVADTPLYGHVHLGSGDPYTPGFPSFNHTQFPPTQSSGLPKIPAQTITAQTATALLQKIGGPSPDASSGFAGGFPSVTYSLGGSQNITVEVNNVLVNKELHNVFGVIKGFMDPDRYVVLGAQRDAWGRGYAKATVGTSVLLELARAVKEMEKDGFKPRRSLVFASWSAGEYGSVGATEWLEGYMSSIDKKVFTYINLDGVVMGRGSFMASASPLLYNLIEKTMKEVESPVGSGSVYDMTQQNKGASVMRPMSMEDPAYPFLTFAGIPSVSFHFITTKTDVYQYYGTPLDNMDHLNYETNQRTDQIAALAAQFAGIMALRLTHDHLLSLDVRGYSNVINKAVVRVNKNLKQQAEQLKEVNPTWLFRARGSFQRAVDSINGAIVNTDLSDKEACRIINDRIMSVEHALLSPYVSPVETPFRHILLGRGSHTLASIAENTDPAQLHTQMALATWSLMGCANAMMGNIWDIDQEI